MMTNWISANAAMHAESLRRDRAAVSLGRRGGKSTSAAKAAAARENGKKGGRPKKKR